jgi:DNA-directed RNA polymerase specialized sigma24 family protein
MCGDMTDTRLRDRLVAGDDGALAEAYDRWSPLVYTVAARITGDRAAAEDLTREVFLHLWQSPDRYDPDRGDLSAWLCRQTRNRARDWLRGGAGRERAAAAASTGWRGETAAIRDAVGGLPEPQRAALLLAYHGGRSYREVARELDIPEGTAKSRLGRAMRSLADRMTRGQIIDR